MADLNQELLALLSANPQLLQQSASQYNPGGWNFSDVMMQRPGSVMSESEAGPQLANAYAFTDRPEMMRQAGASIDPQTGMVSIGGQTMSADDFAKRYKVAMKELSGETGSGATDWQQRLVDSQTGTVAGGDGWTTPGFDLMKDIILPGAAVWGGGYLLGSALGGAGLGGLGGAAGGGDIAGLAADQVGALGLSDAAASAAADAAWLGEGIASGVPAWDAAMAAALPIGEVGAAVAPYVASSADKLALYGAEGYGAGMSGLETLGYDKVLDWTGSKVLADILGPTAGTALDALAPIAKPGLWDTVKSGVGTVANAVGGAGNLAGLVGGIAGAASGGGTNTQTSESKLDPRMAQYLYGSGYGDANSLLGAAQKLYQQNPTGINATMQQGMDMQKAALTDPAYAQSFQAMRNAGTGLLGQGVAANPFASGGQQQFGGLLNMGQPTAQAGGAGGLMNIDPNAANRLIQMGRGLLPNSI